MSFLRIAVVLSAIAAFVQQNQVSAHRPTDLSKRLRTSFNENNENPGVIDIHLGDQAWLTSHDTCVVHHGDWLCSSNGGLALASGNSNNPRVEDGHSSLGHYRTTTWTWTNTNKKGKLAFETYVKAYHGGETVVLGQQWPEGSDSLGVKSADDVTSCFPCFCVQDLASKADVSSSSDETAAVSKRGYLGYAGPFAGYYGSTGEWGNRTESLQGGLGGTGPLIVFSDDHVMVLSAASSFMSVNHVFDKASRTLRYGLMGQVKEVPKGFGLSMVVSLGRDAGINRAVSAWGRKLMTLYGNERPMAKADFTVSTLGYSTDNGAYYYYKTIPGKNYEETMIEIRKHTKELGLPYQYWLLDSWWYTQGIGGGVKNWTAKKSIFPSGAETLYQTTKWPVVAHNRYFAPDNVYAKQNGGKWDFLMEEKMSLPTQQEFWNELFESGLAWGMRTYEQDWLYTQLQGLDALRSNATLGREWLLQMGRAGETHGIPIQYCMSYPRHVLQSVEIPAVTQVRASDDYVVPRQWALGLTSLFLHSLKLAPSKDNFFSTADEWRGTRHESNSRIQAAVSTLSRGPVANADQIGHFNVSLILRSCSSDGNLLRPDRPATMVDFALRLHAGLAATEQAQNSKGATNVGNEHNAFAKSSEIWSTESHVGGFLAAIYLFAAEAKAFDVSMSQLMAGIHHSRHHHHPHHTHTSPNLVRHTHRSFIAFESKTPGTIVRIQNTAEAQLHVSNSINATDFQLWTVVPVLENGWAILGEASDKWVALSSDRFMTFTSSSAKIELGIKGGPHEVVKVWLLPPQEQSVPIQKYVELSSAGEGMLNVDVLSQGSDGEALASSSIER